MKTIKNEYRLSFKYFKENLLKKFLIVGISFILFSIFFTVVLKTKTTVSIPGFQGNGKSTLAETIISEFKRMLDAKGINQPGKKEWLVLFFNNFEACFVSFVYGLLPFLFLPILSLFSNTLIIGAVLSIQISSGTNALKILTLGILPHGIFELTAVFLSLTMGVHLCLNVSRMVLHKEPYESIKRIFSESVRMFVLFILPLLLIAAQIESYITPKLMTFV